MGTRLAAAKCGVSREVVRALKREAWAAGKLDQLKEGAGRRVLGVADAILDRIEDEIDELPKSSLPLAYAILLDKGQLLTGAPTARVETTSRATPESYNAWLESVIDVAAQPVGEGEEVGQKAIAPAVGDGSDAGADGAANRDSQSLVSGQVAEQVGIGGSESGRIEGKKA